MLSGRCSSPCSVSEIRIQVDQADKTEEVSCMVELVKSLRKSVDRKLASFSCWLHGHVYPVLVEEHSRQSLERRFSMHAPLKRVRSKRRFLETFVRGKFKCSHCGSTYLGIVKVIDNETIPHV